MSLLDRFRLSLAARLLPALLLVLPALPARAAGPLTDETAAAMGSFLQICARVLTGGDSAAAAREAGFTAVPAARAAPLLHGATGQVMVARGGSVQGIVLILTSRPLACSMRLQRMDVETAEALFVRLAEGVARPGLTVTRAFDGTVPVPGAVPSPVHRGGGAAGFRAGLHGGCGSGCGDAGSADLRDHGATPPGPAFGSIGDRGRRRPGIEAAMPVVRGEARESVRRAA
jgi:hypothetical protein